MELIELKKGDICLVNFNLSKGKEIGKIRPAVVLSKNEDNEVLDTVVVLPVSSQIVEEAMPYRVFISKRPGLDKDSDVCIYEVRALSKKRVVGVVSKVTADEMHLISVAFAQVFL